MNLAIKRAAVAALSTGAVLVAGAAPAHAGGPFTLTGDASATWSGGGTGAYLTYPVLACGNVTPLDACDATVITVNPTNPEEGPATLRIDMTPAAATDDFDVFVYRDADGDGEPEGDAFESETTGLGAGEPETITLPDATGTYLVEIVNFLSVGGAFDAVATLDSPADPATAGAARSSAAAETAAVEASLARALAAARK